MTLESDLASFDTEQVPLCNLCGTPGQPDLRWAQLLALPNRYGVLQCFSCRLRWLSPRPSQGAQKIIYNADNYFGAGETGYAQFAAIRREQFEARVRAMIEQGVGSVLDYGAATGDFVGIAQSMGLRAEGVEFSEDARDQAARRGIKLHAPGAGIGRFDAIHMNHVLEHLPNPLEHLEWCARKLNPKGLLWIEVPFQFDNDLEVVRRMVGRSKPSFNAFSLHHTYFFTSASLARLCERAGFLVEALEQPYMSAPWRNSGLLKIFIALSKKRGNGDVLVLKARRRWD